MGGPYLILYYFDFSVKQAFVLFLYINVFVERLVRQQYIVKKSFLKQIWELFPLSDGTLQVKIDLPPTVSIAELYLWNLNSFMMILQLNIKD